MDVFIIQYLEMNNSNISVTDNGYKDLILTLMQRGANLDLVDTISVHVHMLYYNYSLSICILSLPWLLLKSPL